MPRPIWTLAVLAACASVSPPPSGPNEPGDPRAAEVPVPPASSTLDTSQPAMPPPSREEKGAMEGMHHGGADAGMAMSGMEGMSGMKGMPGMSEPVDAGGSPPKHHHGASATPDAGAKQPADYTCVMHPEVSSPSPGKCPKCGMTLVPRKGAKP